jgi:diguanylate cyclase (GGDEF)-like protein
MEAAHGARNISGAPGPLDSSLNGDLRGAGSWGRGNGNPPRVTLESSEDFADQKGEDVRDEVARARQSESKMSEPTDSNAEDHGSISLLLVGEDDFSAKRLFEVLARPEGTRFEITRVLGVEDALAKLQHESFDVLLLDLSIDESDGLGSLLRARVAARSIPIVVLTYERDEAVALKAARAGAQDYLTKGEVTPALISRTLLHAVERHRMLRDLTEAQQRQHFLATHDSLTELPNRYSFLAQLKTALADADRSGRQLAVMFFDLDGFKAVNDNLGHPVGDELLQDVAKRLRRMVRKCDLIARIGGDEFLAAVRNVPSAKAAARVADHIREEIEKPYHLAGYECWVSASIGVAMFPGDGTDADQIIRSADTALYEAKESGKNRVCLFNGSMNDKAAERFELVNGLREAIHGGQLMVMFQPQVAVATEELVGFETLVRWKHPTRGLVSPTEFIGVAEETGMMVLLGEWVLRTACEAAAGWTRLHDARVAVNISGRQLDQEDFPERVQTILRETGLPAHRLEVELTESLAASDSALLGLRRLREMGVRTAIDDFGTGYSSLTLLKRLPVDMLKIDQSFVRGAAVTDPDAVILEAIIRMARGLGLDVLAEGVETVEEMDSLSQRGCNLMQGYLFAKPIPRQELEDTVCGPDAAWRIPIMRAESWCPSDLDLGPAPTSEPAPAPAEVVPEGEELVVELEAESKDDDADLPALHSLSKPPEPTS